MTETKLFSISNGEVVELHSVEEVACFIYEKGLYEDVTIRKADGSPFIITFGPFLGWIADMNYRDKLLEVLIPIQTGEATVSDIMARCGSEGGGGV